MFVWSSLFIDMLVNKALTIWYCTLHVSWCSCKIYFVLFWTPDLVSMCYIFFLIVIIIIILYYYYHFLETFFYFLSTLCILKRNPDTSLSSSQIEFLVQTFRGPPNSHVTKNNFQGCLLYSFEFVALLYSQARMEHY